MPSGKKQAPAAQAALFDVHQIPELHLQRAADGQQRPDSHVGAAILDPAHVRLLEIAPRRKILLANPPLHPQLHDPPTDPVQNVVHDSVIIFDNKVFSLSLQIGYHI